MPKVSKIIYDPHLSVEENVELNKKKGNEITKDAIRYYIHSRNIDRRKESEINIVEACRKVYLAKSKHGHIPTKSEIRRNAVTGKKDKDGNDVLFSMSTIRKYWDKIIGKEAIDFGSINDKKITEFEDGKGRRSTKDYPLMSELLKTTKDYLELTEQDDVSKLREWLLSNPNMPLICIGNGGKHSSFPALLYEMNKGIAKTITPLEFASMSKEAIKSSKILLLTGSGHNMDISYAASRARFNKENASCVFFHYDKKKSKAINSLKGKNNPIEGSNCFLFDHETDEGFIDIQSKFLTYGLFYKAFTNEERYADKLNYDTPLDKCYKYEVNFEGRLPKLKTIKHIDILYGSFGEPVAKELESALVESGLCSASATDYRNYCHGRFMLTSNSTPRITAPDITETAILLLITPRERRIANQLRKNVFPSPTPIISIKTDYLSPLASIDLLYKSFAFVADFGENHKGYNPNNPLNKSSIDKRVAKKYIEFVDDVKKFGLLGYKEPDKEALKIEIGQEIEAIEAQEKEATEYLEQTKPIPVFPTVADLRKEEKEVYDATKILTYAFRRKYDLRKGQSIPFGNMNKGFPFKLFGQTFQNSECAYISGMFSNGTPEHIEVQQALIEEENGYSAKKEIRHNNENIARTTEDWESFNVEWMLYVVWQKVKQNRKFRELLLAVPDNAIIIEDTTYQKGEKSKFWGAENKARKQFSLLVEEKLELENLDISIDEEDEERDKIVNDVCNYGIYEGGNTMGKILTICRQCLKDKTEPEIDYELLKSKHIHMLGEEVDFDKQYRASRKRTEKVEPVKVEPAKEPKKKTEPSSRISPSKIFESPNGKYDIVVCHSSLDAQIYVDESKYQFPSWCFCTSEGSFVHYTSHTKPLGKKGGVLIMFFRKDSNSIKAEGHTKSDPLLCDNYAMTVFSITTDFGDDGKPYLRSLTNRYNNTRDIGAKSKPKESEAEEIRKGVIKFNELTGMDIEAFSIENTPEVLDKREDYGFDMFDEVYKDDKLTLLYPNLDLPKDKKIILCRMIDEDGDEVLYDLQPSGVLHPHGFPHDCVNELLSSFPKEAIDVIGKIRKRYLKYYKEGVKVERVKNPKAKKASTKHNGITQEFPLEGKMYHSVLGAIIGDISGSSREGHNTDKLDNKFFTAASTFTDDSVLTIALADWLNNKDTMSVEDALKYWGNRFPRAGYGKTFLSFLKPKKNKPFENISTSNGAAMRVSPVALKAKSLDEALSLAEESAAPSHTGGGIKGAQAIAAATFIAKDGVALGKSADEIKADIRSFVVERFNLNLNRSIEDIRELIMPLAAKDREDNKTKKGKEKPTFEEWKTCDALLSSEMALTAVMYSTTYEEAVRIAISMGGDSDTIAAMAGSVAAQLYGIPEALIRKALVYLPSEMIDVINKFEGADFQPTGIKPPQISRWSIMDVVVFGADPENKKRDEDGHYETRKGAHMKGYPIPTIGKSLDEIQAGVKKFIEVAKAHPENRYLVHKVGYHKTDYTLQQIAPMFKEAVGMKNVLMREDMLNELLKESE